MHARLLIFLTLFILLQLVVSEDCEPGDRVNVLTGPMKDMKGYLESEDKEKGTAKVLVTLFGRETIVNLERNSIKCLGE